MKRSLASSAYAAILIATLSGANVNEVSRTGLTPRTFLHRT